MRYVSTRGGGEADGLSAVLQGIAPDGGLYADPELGKRRFDWRSCLTLDPFETAEKILCALLPDFEDMGHMVRRAYEDRFDSPELAPLVKAGDQYVLELWHGPTAAFKDVALSMLPQLIAGARRQRGETGESLILTATSGDTGKAALEGFRDVPGTRVLVFYPEGGVSEVQQRQMRTQEGKNLGVCAVRGNFDDCQRGVKAAFATLRGNTALKERGVRLSSANSINIGRLAPQLSYYFLAYASLVRQGRIQVGEPVDYTVPTGNFGDILAGWYAKLLGLPIGRLICATNANNVLEDFIQTGHYDARRTLLKTSSPSMDILVSSNLERLLFGLTQDPERVRRWMEELERQGHYQIDPPLLRRIQEDFEAFSCREEETLSAIGQLWRETGYLCDTHTAAAYHAAKSYRQRVGGSRAMVLLSTASPFKFPGAVLQGMGERPMGDGFEQMEQLEAVSGKEIPGSLRSLRDRPERHKDCISRQELCSYILEKMEGKR